MLFEDEIAGQPNPLLPAYMSETALQALLKVGLALVSTNGSSEDSHRWSSAYELERKDLQDVAWVLYQGKLVAIN